jgi:hypothetical protein
MFPYLRTSLLLIVLAASLAACGGGGGSSGGSGAASNNGGSADSGSANASLTCDASTTNPYAGCFVSNNCVSVTGTTNYSNITLQFMNDGTLVQTVSVYAGAGCSGKVVSSYSLPMNQTYAVLQDQPSSSGLKGQYIQVGTSITGISQTSTSFTLAYLDNNQLCFSQNDYAWTSSGGGFQPLAVTQNAANLSLNLTDCLSRM